ncbi:MAG TPA: ParA family protein [Burkholderiales bacterium]|nr:ParA family protein [Burkholderiales bacterium]
MVTRGYLRDIGATALLQALSLSRQYTAVVLFTESQELAGRVTLKSGMVLEASIPGTDLTGAAAFRELVSRHLHSFQVERLPPLSVYPVPIGRLSAQLHAAQVPDVNAPAAPPHQPQADRGSGTMPIARDVRQLDPAPAVAPAVAPVVAPPIEASVGKSTSSRWSDAPKPEGRGTVAPVLGIASPKGGCGKTTIALNLAVSLANAGLRVVLVDADPNGDVLSAISGRERPRRGGIFDALERGHDGSEFELETVIDRLRLVPATNGDVTRRAPDIGEDGSWQDVLRGIRDHADLVIVDLPAGMHGITSRVLDGCTHVLGVLQAETIPKRSFSMFQRGLEALPRAPEVVGVVLNMFRRSHSASLSVLVDAGVDFPPSWMFETTIPRNDAFLDAAEEGMPVALAGNSGTFIGLLFDTLAKELTERMKLGKIEKAKAVGSFLR